MKKAFFGAAGAGMTSAQTPQILSQVDTDDHIMQAAQTAAYAAFADDQAYWIQYLAQSEANVDADELAKDTAFWANYQAQVAAVLEAGEAPEYWTDGYASLSQNEVQVFSQSKAQPKATIKSKARALNQVGGSQWMSGLTKGISNMAKKTGSAIKAGAKATGKAASSAGRSISKGAEIAGNAAISGATSAARSVSAGVAMAGKGIAMVAGEVGKVGMIAYDTALQALPTQAQITALLDKLPVVKQIGQTLMKAGVNTADMVSKFVEKHEGAVDDCVAVLKAFPLTAPFVSQIEDTIQGGKNVVAILKGTFGPDDGLPKTCWMKSKMRRFEWPGTACKPDQQKQLGICYDKCTEGKGTGPVCWGSCPEGTAKCGVLCIKTEEEKKVCRDYLLKTGTNAIAAGAFAASGNIVGAVVGSLAVVGNLIHPVCKSF